MDSLFFSASKIVWLLVSPDTWILLLCVLATVLCFRAKFALLRVVLVVLTLLITSITFLPLGEWLLYPLETRYAAPKALPQHVDGIITLGGGEYPALSLQWGEPEFNEAVERYTVFVEMLNRYPEAQGVVSSGSGSLTNQSLKGADVIKEFLQQQGIDTTAIFFERQSRNTYENLLFSQRILEPRADQQWLVITSAYHMPRVMGIAQKLGWSLIAYPVDHYTMKNDLLRSNFNFSINLKLLNVALREYLGLLGYRVFGKSAVLFPG